MLPGAARCLLRRLHKHLGRIHRPAAGKQSTLGSAHRTGVFVDSDHRAPGNQLTEHPGEILDPFIEFEVDRAVHMVGGQVGLPGRAFPERQEQVRPFVVGEHDGPVEWPSFKGALQYATRTAASLRESAA